MRETLSRFFTLDFHRSNVVFVDIGGAGHPAAPPTGPLNQTPEVRIDVDKANHKGPAQMAENSMVGTTTLNTANASTFNNSF